MRNMFCTACTPPPPGLSPIVSAEVGRLEAGGCAPLVLPSFDSFLSGGSSEDVMLRVRTLVRACVKLVALPICLVRLRHLAGRRSVVYIWACFIDRDSCRARIARADARVSAWAAVSLVDAFGPSVLVGVSMILSL